MARGEDTGHHPHRKVGRERFETPYEDDFDTYAVQTAGVTPQSSTWNIEDAAARFVDEHLGHQGSQRDKTIDSLVRGFHESDDDWDMHG